MFTFISVTVLFESIKTDWCSMLMEINLVIFINGAILVMSG